MSAVESADLWMREYASAEVATLIAEDTHDVKETIQSFHQGYTNPDGSTQFEGRPIFRTFHIVESVLYAKKQDALLLQLADHCAFIVKRKLMDRPEFEELYWKIEPQIHSTTDPPKSAHILIPRKTHR